MAFEDEDFEAVPAHGRFADLVARTGRAFHSDSPATAVQGALLAAPG